MEKNTGDFLQSSKSVPSVWPSRALLRQAICPTSLGKSVRFLLGCRLLRVARRDNSPARKRRFSEAIQADLGRPVPLPKILCLCCRANQRHRLRPSRLDTRGASRSSRTLGAGCDGRFGDARRAALVRTAKPCGPDAPTLASSWRSDPQAMVAIKPGHQGEHGISRKPLRREGRNVRRTCGDDARALFCLRARLRVHRAPGFPCALSFSRAISGSTRALSRRGRVESQLGVV